MILDILEEQVNQPVLCCVVGKWAKTLTAEEQEVLTRVQGLPKFNSAELYRKLTARTELPFKLTSFKSHMRGICTCQQ